MKKILFISVLALTIMVGCDKNNGNDPVNPVSSDSTDVRVRVYATKDMMDHMYFQYYFTFNGDSAERMIPMTTTVAVEDCDKMALAWYKEEYIADSMCIYDYRARVKKGKGSYRFDYEVVDSLLPEKVDLFFGVYVSPAMGSFSYSTQNGMRSEMVDSLMKKRQALYPMEFTVK